MQQVVRRLLPNARYRETVLSHLVQVTDLSVNRPHQRTVGGKEREQVCPPHEHSLPPPPVSMLGASAGKPRGGQAQVLPTNQIPK